MAGNKENEDDDGRTGSSGSGGKVEFRTFIGNERGRDDLLPPDERKRLLAVHDTLNKESVKKQKARFDEYQRLKDGKTSLQEFRHAASQEYPFKPHTILSKEAQFGGSSDRQVSNLPNENNADTNKDKKELRYENRLENRPKYANAPSLAPTPSPFK
jgi:hypothetical protein